MQVGLLNYEFMVEKSFITEVLNCLQVLQPRYVQHHFVFAFLG